MDRIERVNSLIREIIADILARKTKDPRIGMVTIHNVVVSRDLRTAKIFFGVTNLAEKEQTQQALDSAAPFIRKELGKEIKFRFTPELTFIYDDSYEKSDRIFQILRSLKKNEPA
ncbi:MAG: 30S ribosome-binding factor RbfA [Candidatus Wallbacteria bacterium]|nr:30S ribosome-binding factor RbfA [Candidatus Wallbacteria bacterium]